MTDSARSELWARLTMYLQRRYTVSKGLVELRPDTSGDAVQFESLLGALEIVPRPALTIGRLAKMFTPNTLAGGLPGWSVASACLLEGAELGLWETRTYEQVFPDEKVQEALGPTLARELRLIAVPTEGGDAIIEALQGIQNQIRGEIDRGVQRMMKALTNDVTG